MEKLTTAYVRESLARVPYEYSLDPMTLQEMRERMVTVQVGDWRVKVTEIDMLNITYHAHMTQWLGACGVYLQAATLSGLVRKINKRCLQEIPIHEGGRYQTG